MPTRFICRADGQGFNEFACAGGEQCREYEGVTQCAPPCPDPDRMYRDEQGLCRCEEGYVFNETSRRCERCMPDCTGRECGEDPLCGQSCGTCETGTSCQVGLCEQCECGEQECGQGPCGLFCGDCAANARCQGGRCVTDVPEDPPLSNVCCVGLAGSCPLLSPYPAGTACYCVDIYGFIYYGETCTL